MVTLPGNVLLCLLALLPLAACGKEALASQNAQKPAAAAPAAVSDALPASATGGFDGAKAFAHVEKLVSLGPRPPGSEAIHRAQEYISSQLKSFGCVVEEDDFEAPTPQGRIKMKNIVGKAAGESPNVLMVLSHYDTKYIPDKPNFVGANDSGSSTGVVLELARNVCPRKNKLSVWLAFVDGEEDYVEWSETDGTFGSRQMAAKLSLAGELRRVKAMVLLDLVGFREPHFMPDANSTKWLNDLIWATAKRLGYDKVFTSGSFSVQDDHIPFLRRGVPAVDIIQLNDYPYWHTAQDTLDKISARSLGIVGHVVLETLPEVEKKVLQKGKQVKPDN